MQFFLISILIALVCPIAAQTPFPLETHGSRGCGEDNFRPTFHTAGEFPVIGSHSFKIISRNLRPAAPGFLAISLKKANIWASGFPWFVDPFCMFGLIHFAHGPYGIPGAGKASISLPIPKELSLIGGSAYIQNIFLEPGHSKEVFVWTNAIKVSFCKDFPVELTILYDVNKYKHFFKNVTPVKAQEIGKRIWSKVPLTGFKYKSTIKYSCGGQSFYVATVTHTGSSVDFQLIPGGSIQMGDTNNTSPPYHHRRATPAHWVRIRPFLLAQTEITQKQWEAAMGYAPYKGKQYSYKGKNPEDHAANYISAFRASSFCKKYGWRFPSGSEWEYACRAGTTTDFYFGKNYPLNPKSILSDYEWQGLNAGTAEPYPHKVGQKKPNAFGLYDMGGNVSEVVEGSPRFLANYNCAPTNGRPWDSGVQINRGGFWGVATINCVSSYRTAYQSDSSVGIRPALSLR